MSPRSSRCELSGRQGVARGAVPGWLSGQAARCRMAVAQTQWGLCGDIEQALSACVLQ